MTLTKLSTALAIGLMATALCFSGDAQEPAKVSKEAEPDGVKRQTSAPEYDAKGNLLLPTDFKTWVFVGANLGLDYQQDVAAGTPREKKTRETAIVGDFHNVYINPEAYEQYLKTGKFPDKTVLVMDVYQAKDKEPQNVVVGGHFPGANRSVEVAVKNNNRPDGSKTPWAYYAFLVPKKGATAKAFKDATCFDCHMKHADDDNVWVQFYPTIRDVKKGEGK
jgi:Cytochrome P460